MSNSFPNDSKVLPPAPPAPPAPSAPPPAYPASSSSSSVPHTPGPPLTFACLLLSQTDRIRLIAFPDNVISPIATAIGRVWASGIQSQGPYKGGGYEWKLSGRPWSGSGHEAVPSGRLLIHVLHALAQIGWHLFVSTDLSKKVWDKDTLIFRPGPPVSRYYFAISFNM